ncbi:17040_t:CDS:2 [Acaulospora colombiana]|uniref:17040_t:CDS:1 n=1 Tax=Acaulospora colombiana TaxID=27376 RepID=A0ACA9P2L7_9GLOM|nr:17040_t:CDS:2 [Acaulospora colombiana]
MSSEMSTRLFATSSSDSSRQGTPLPAGVPRGMVGDQRAKTPPRERRSSFALPNDSSESDCIRQRHMAAKARHRQSKLKPNVDRMLPIMPSPFFTFHCPVPKNHGHLPARTTRKAGSYAPEGKGQAHHAYTTHNISQDPYAFIREPKRPKPVANPYDLPSSEDLIPPNLRLLDEDVEMMDLDEDLNSPLYSQPLEDPFH